MNGVDFHTHTYSSWERKKRNKTNSTSCAREQQYRNGSIDSPSQAAAGAAVFVNTLLTEHFYFLPYMRINPCLDSISSSFSSNTLGTLDATLAAATAATRQPCPANNPFHYASLPISQLVRRFSSVQFSSVSGSAS